MKIKLVDVFENELCGTFKGVKDFDNANGEIIFYGEEDDPYYFNPRYERCEEIKEED